MKAKNTPDFAGKIYAIAPFFFAVAMVLCTLFLVIGEVFAPNEKDPLDKRIRYINSGWYRVTENGDKEPLEIPCNLDVPWGELVTIGTIIPDDVRNGDYICFRPVWQDVWVYLDGELRATHDLSDSRPYGKNSAFKYVFVELNEKDASCYKKLYFIYMMLLLYLKKVKIYYYDK